MTLEVNNTRLFGTGLGLRSEHLDAILQPSHNGVQWFEVLVDNYLDGSAPALKKLDLIAASFPLTFHSVGLNLGGTSPYDLDKMKTIKELLRRYQPLNFSDHISWCAYEGRHHHDLLPMPMHDESVQHFARRAKEAQDLLDFPLVIENISSYLPHPTDLLYEWEYVSAVSAESGCSLLVDVNNIFVNCTNLELDWKHYIEALVGSTVEMYHIAGHQSQEGLLIDNHGANVKPEVLDVLKFAIKKLGAAPVLLERDNNIPEYGALVLEAKQIAGVSRDD